MGRILDLRKYDSSESKLIDKIAEKIRDDYVEFLSKIGRKNENDIDWWMLDFVSRNTFASDLFFNFCKLIFFRQKIRSARTYKKIIVGSVALKIVIEKYCIEHKYECKVVCIREGKSKLLLKLKLRYIKACMHLFFFWIFRRIIVLLNQKRKIANNLILLDTFILKNSFNNGDYYDRYYGELYNILSEVGGENVYYLPTYSGIRNYLRLFKNINKSKKCFLIKEDYLQLKDYLYAFQFSSRASKLEIYLEKFMDFDVSTLIRSEILESSLSSSSMVGILNSILGKRLREKNVKIKSLINWFENQTIDHGLNYSFRKYFPETDLIGFIGFPLINNYLSLYATEQELSCRVIPKVVKVIGKGYVESVKKYCPNLKVEVAPALRFSGVWKEREIYPEQGKFVIFVALPMLMYEAEELIEVILKVDKKLKINNYFFQIKPHPTQDIKAMKVKWKGKLTKQFEFVQGDFNFCIEKSNILISGTSGTCLETLAKGIPVILVGNKFGLTQLTIPKGIGQDVWKLCYGVREMCDAIIFYMNRDVATIRRHEEIGHKIREKYFEPVTREGVRKFLRLQ